MFGMPYSLHPAAGAALILFNPSKGSDRARGQVGTQTMSQPAKGQEPSMDEILASIRRIIADDDPGQMPARGNEPQFSTASRPANTQSDLGASAPMRAAVPPERATRSDEIDSMLAQLQAATRPPSAAEESGAAHGMGAAAPMPDFPTTDEPPNVASESSLAEATIPRVEKRGAVPEAAVPAASERGLLSGAAASAVDSAFNELAHTVQVRNGRTLEDFVAELLRPMLKIWLDENLPAMVERLVRAEIERVSRGRG
jgi:cell pole-organizing protein PopZ